MSRNPVTMRSRIARAKKGARNVRRRSGDCRARWDEAWRCSGVVVGTLVMLTAQHPPWNRFVPTILVSCTYQFESLQALDEQCATPAPEHTHRVSRRGRAREPARCGRSNAPHAQCGQSADSRAGGAVSYTHLTLP